MNLFKFINKYILKKEASSEIFDIISEPEVLKEAVRYEEEIVFQSDVITEISENLFIDTTSPLAIAKYKNNLKLLVEDTKRKGFVEQFRLIRDDDYFPHNWEWRVGSKDTAIELDHTPISYAIRKCIAYQNMGIDIKNSFLIPSMDKGLNEEISKIDKNIGSVISPVKFRSTKHFTVNTPLSYTGEYNFVEANRNFTVIDTLDNFLSSGYAYTADYKDAYLDVTHEGLKISEQAIVLISEDKYNTIINDPTIAEQLNNRRVIVYRGEEAVAINMILTENGILPARPGNKYMIYDDEIRTILESSMQRLCSINNIQYAKGHGNLFGKGGHFSDLYDGYNHDYEKSREDFLSFLLKSFPQAEGILNSQVYRDVSAAEDFVNLVGIEPLLNAISEYNGLVTQQYYERYQNYLYDRSSITPEISQMFKHTVQFIDNFYLAEKEKELSMDDLYRFKELVRLFFHSNTVEQQLNAAYEIDNMFSLSFSNNLEEERGFSI